MDFLNANPMPVADHFMTFDTHTRQSYSTMQSANETAGDQLSVGEVCEMCYVYCVDKMELWRHVRDEHGANEKLACPAPECGRRFFALAMSAAHSAHHLSDVKPFTCELCGHLLRNRSTFEKHMAKMHPEARVALCGICQLYMGDVPSLVDHVQHRHGTEIELDVTCMGDRTRRCIRCDVCGKRYGNNRNMYAHRRLHGVMDCRL